MPGKPGLGQVRDIFRVSILKHQATHRVFF
jgi:hypothetical protein